MQVQSVNTIAPEKPILRLFHVFFIIFEKRLLSLVFEDETKVANEVIGGTMLTTRLIISMDTKLLILSGNVRNA